MTTAPGQPWDLSSLGVKPPFAVIADDGAITSVLYQGEPYGGSPTRIFAYMGVPAGQNGPVPGMICVHGGGGRAFKEWVALWNARGYAAIAMDLVGNGPAGRRLADGGPPQDEALIFRDPRPDWGNHWVYHAVAGVIRGHSLLRSQAGVDPERIGLTGISWGGYLTCIAAGLDARFGCAIPVYGCGFLEHNSVWSGAFAGMNPGERAAWNELCDPSAYLGRARMPMLFVNGTNDFAYPLDSYKLSYGLVTAPLTLCIRPTMAHGHEEGWAPGEIALFANHRFRGGPALPWIGPMTRAGREVSAPVGDARQLVAGEFVYTHDRGTWQERTWQQAPARLEGQRVWGTVPQGASVYYLAVTDAAGAYVSCPHVEEP